MFTPLGIPICGVLFFSYESHVISTEFFYPKKYCCKCSKKCVCMCILESYIPNCLQLIQWKNEEGKKMQDFLARRVVWGYGLFAKGRQRIRRNQSGHVWPHFVFHSTPVTSLALINVGETFFSLKTKSNHNSNKMYCCCFSACWNVFKYFKNLFQYVYTKCLCTQIYYLHKSNLPKLLVSTHL